MDRHQAEEMMRNEGLLNFALFENPEHGDADKVLLYEADGRWHTAITSEHGSILPRTVREFDSESAALADMIDGLRVLKKSAEL
ncbi:hypothetical protein [Sinomonas albida]|uniref:hypothetical protein n=1 Tax=Sinomonas albida TaxID=369942 RepID=UPI00301B1A8C